MGASLLVVLTLIAQAPQAEDAAALKAQSSLLAGRQLETVEREIKSLTAEASAAKRGRVNARATSDKQVVAKNNVVYRTRDAQKDDVEKLTKQLEAARDRLGRLKRETEIVVPTIGDDDHRVGSFYVLQDGSAFEVDGPTSCLWQISYVTSVGGGFSGTSFQTLRTSRSTKFFLLKGLDPVNRDDPQTLKLQGTIFKFTGTVPRGGESVDVFERVSQATLDAARKP